MTHTLSIIIAAALVNNLVLVQFLGVSSLFYATRRLSQAIEFAAFTFVVLFLASLANLLLYRYVLVPLQLEVLRLVLFVISSAALSACLLQLLAKNFPLSLRQQSILLFLTGGNSAVLGTALLSATNSFSTLENIAFSFGAALGYAFVIVAFSAMRGRLESADIPAPFRGDAIHLITAGLIALSLLGFAGLT